MEVERINVSEQKNKWQHEKRNWRVKHSNIEPEGRIRQATGLHGNWAATTYVSGNLYMCLCLGFFYKRKNEQVSP